MSFGENTGIFVNSGFATQMLCDKQWCRRRNACWCIPQPDGLCFSCGKSRVFGHKKRCGYDGSSKSSRFTRDSKHSHQESRYSCDGKSLESHRSKHSYDSGKYSYDSGSKSDSKSSKSSRSGKESRHGKNSYDSGKSDAKSTQDSKYGWDECSWCSVHKTKKVEKKHSSADWDVESCDAHSDFSGDWKQKDLKKKRKKVYKIWDECSCDVEKDVKKHQKHDWDECSCDLDSKHFAKKHEKHDCDECSCDSKSDLCKGDLCKNVVKTLTCFKKKCPAKTAVALQEPFPLDVMIPECVKIPFDKVLLDTDNSWNNIDHGYLIRKEGIYNMHLDVQLQIDRAIGHTGPAASIQVVIEEVSSLDQTPNFLRPIQIALADIPQEPGTYFERLNLAQCLEARKCLVPDAQHILTVCHFLRVVIRLVAPVVEALEGVNVTVLGFQPDCNEGTPSVKEAPTTEFIVERI